MQMMSFAEYFSVQEYFFWKVFEKFQVVFAFQPKL